MSATRIYFASVDPLYDESLFSKCYNQSTTQRRQKIDSFRFQKDKCLSLGVELCLKAALLECGIDLNHQTISANQYGKPSLEKADLKYNLSHSGRYVMCVTSPFEVGCDIQSIHRDYTSVAQRFFNPAEREYIFSQPTEQLKNDAFYRLWTLKESFIKANGRGLSISLDSFSMNIGAASITVDHPTDENKYRFIQPDVHPDYKSAVCVINPDDNMNFEIKIISFE